MTKLETVNQEILKIERIIIEEVSARDFFLSELDVLHAFRPTYRIYRRFGKRFYHHDILELFKNEIASKFKQAKTIEHLRVLTTRMLDKAVSAKLLVKLKSPEDKRKVVYELTPEALELFEALERRYI